MMCTALQPNGDPAGQHELDALGNEVRERPEKNIVRFSNYHPGRNAEAFFYNVMLSKVRMAASMTCYLDVSCTGIRQLHVVQSMPPGICLAGGFSR